MVSNPVDHAAVQAAFPEWEVDPDPLGEGGFKNAYHVRRAGQDCVLKIVRQPLATRPEEETSDEDLVLPETVMREIAAMRNVRSPHVVSILLGPETREVDGAARVWYLEPFFPNGSLAERMANPWEESDVVVLMLQLLVGIEALDDQHLVHRDIKPENIVFDEDDRAVLLDLGIALHLDEERLTGPDQLGPRTPAYAAPEQFEVRRLSSIDFRTDLFLLGVVAFQILTGVHPFEPARDGYMQRLMNGEYSADALAATSPSDCITDVLKRLLGAAPNQRYRKLEFARDAIEGCQ